VSRIRLLLGKDLRVLARSPALLAALILYPIVFAVLVGLVVRYANDRPRVAFVDLDDLPRVLAVGGEEFNVEQVINEVSESAELVPMSEEEANRKLANGEVAAAIVVPRGFATRLRGMVESPRLVLKTMRGGLAGRVEQQTQALVYNLNRLLQTAYIEANLEYVKLILEGGQGSFLGNEFDVVGLEEAAVILDGIQARTNDPAIRAEAEELEVFVREARLALGASGDSLRATANPIELEIDTEAGRTWLLSAQLQSYALALTLAFICVLIAAAATAAERDENVIGRLARGLVRLSELVAVKVLLAAAVGVALGLTLAVIFGVMAEVFGVTGGEPWERLPLLAVGLAVAGAAFGAFGAFVGVIAREAKTAVLVAFLAALPIVLVGLVPEGSVAALGWLSDVFPFRHSIRFFEAALFDLDPWTTLAREAAWLLVLGALFATAARIGVRRLLT
jgi:ABC-2 type transport system permease protein